MPVSFPVYRPRNPHGHVLITDGCFPEKDLFKVVPAVKINHLEKIFRSKVLTLLLSKGKSTPDHINLLKSWKHSGFQVFCGPRIPPRKKEAMENLARYIIRAFSSQERMTYLPEPVVSLKVERESRIIYRSKDKRHEKICFLKTLKNATPVQVFSEIHGSFFTVINFNFDLITPSIIGGYNIMNHPDSFLAPIPAFDLC
jgi:hypothetical protein